MTRHYPLLLLLIVFVLMVTSTTAIGAADGSNRPRQAQSAAAQHGEATAAYGGEIFLDLNFNGIREHEEPGMAAVKVTVEKMDGPILQETLSDDDGIYFFENLPTAELLIRVWPPTGYRITANGAFTITTALPQGPVSVETGLVAGLFLPVIRTW